MEGYSKEDYLSVICNQIKWGIYRNKVKEELSDFIDDEIEFYAESGDSKDVATNKVLSEIGDPKLVGRNFDEIYTKDIKKKIIYIFFYIFPFFVLEAIPVVLSLGNKIWIISSIISLAISILVFIRILQFDWSKRSGYKKLVMIWFATFFGALLYCEILHKNITYDKELLCSVWNLTSVFLCLTAVKIRGMKLQGLVVYMASWSITVIIPVFLHVYASGIIMFFVGLICLLVMNKLNWIKCEIKKPIVLIFVLPMLAVSVIGWKRKYQEILMNYNTHFTHDILLKSNFYGIGGFGIMGGERIIDYPISLLIGYYGRWISIIYFLIVLAVAIKLIKKIRKIKNEQSIIWLFTMVALMSAQLIIGVISNIGISISNSIHVPFLDYEFMIIADIVILGIMEFVILFGDYLYSAEKQNKLFEFENGKLIINYR